MNMLNNRHGNKAAYLQLLQQHGVPVPEFTLIGSNTDAKIAKKLSAEIGYPQIIRSSHTIEDEGSYNYPGIFYSKVVRNKQDFASSLKDVKQKNNAALRTVSHVDNISLHENTATYIIQKYVPSKFGGIMVVTSTDKNRFYAEYSNITDGVTSGMVNPTKTYIQKNASENSEDWQKQLAAIGNTVAATFQFDSEIEWLLGTDNTVYLVQSRKYIQVEYSLDDVVKDEIQRLQETYPLHRSKYSNNQLPDISNPTPITLETIGLVYSRVGGGQHTSFMTIAGNPYLDTFYHTSAVSNFVSYNYTGILKAIRFSKHPNDTLQSVNKNENAAYYIRFIDTKLSDAILNNSELLQVVQRKICKIAKVNVTDPVFVAKLSQLTLDYNELSRNDFINKYWYMSVNEYELSSERLQETNTFSLDLPNGSSEHDARAALEATIISAIDRVYVNKLLYLYDVLAEERARLHNVLIETIAHLRFALLEIDNDMKLHDMIWYATLDEIIRNNIPDLQVLVARKKRWQTLQAMKIRDPNIIQSWEELFEDSNDDASERYTCDILSPGYARGVIGKDIVVLKSLNYNILGPKQAVKGVITERGGQLSHLALLARERGLVIVKISNATSIFSLGQSVEIRDNTVRLIE